MIPGVYTPAMVECALGGVPLDGQGVDQYISIKPAGPDWMAQVGMAGSTQFTMMGPQVLFNVEITLLQKSPSNLVLSALADECIALALAGDPEPFVSFAMKDFSGSTQFMATWCVIEKKPEIARKKNADVNVWSVLAIVGDSSQVVVGT